MERIDFGILRPRPRIIANGEAKIRINGCLHPKKFLILNLCNSYNS